MLVNLEQINSDEEVLGWQNADLLTTIKGLEQDGDMEGAAALRSQATRTITTLNVLENPASSAVDVVAALQQT